MINVTYTTPGKYELTLNPGIYKLEVWGAQGGVAETQQYHPITPGNGGYSTGIISIKKRTDIFAYVGGQGQTKGVGGFNGGGNVSGSDTASAGGGGGSDIRVGIDDLHSRVIVAGGGGGYEFCQRGSYAGAGGGEIGQDGYQKEFPTCGSGGTQTSPGTHKGNGAAPGFGYGGCASTIHTGAGGGGWYGGGSGEINGEGGGGSGYVFTADTYASYPNPLISRDYFLLDATTIAGDTVIKLPNGASNKGNDGDGAIRIVQLSQSNKIDWYNVYSKIIWYNSIFGIFSFSNTIFFTI